MDDHEPPILLRDALPSTSAGHVSGPFLCSSKILPVGLRDNKPQTATIDSSSGVAVAGPSNQCKPGNYHQPVLPNPALQQYLEPTPEDHIGPTTDRQDPMTIGDPWQSSADLSATSEREFILVRKTQVVNWMSDVVNAVEYECRICCRRFRWRSSIYAHIRTHTGRKPYPCRTCQVNFSDSSTRNKHEKKAHNLNHRGSQREDNSPRLGEPTAASAGCFERRLQVSRRAISKCHHCNVSFSSESDLAGHINQFHNHVVPRFPEAFAGQRGLASGGVGVEPILPVASGGGVGNTRAASAFQRPTSAWLMDGALQFQHQHQWHQRQKRRELPQQYQELPQQYKEMSQQHLELTLQYQELPQQYKAMSQQHLELTQQFQELPQQYKEMSQQHLELTQQYQELKQQYQEHIPLPAATAMSVGDACIDVGELMDPATALDLYSNGEVIGGGSCYQSEAVLPSGGELDGYYCADDVKDLVQILCQL